LRAPNYIACYANWFPFHIRVDIEKAGADLELTSIIYSVYSTNCFSLLRYLRSQVSSISTIGAFYLAIHQGMVYFDCCFALGYKKGKEERTLP